MDYEKKYKEALERARQFSEKPYLEDSKDIVDYLFPELKESGDEKIRKEILDYIIKGSESCYDVQQYGREKFEKWITWLESQGEHAKFCDSIQVGDKVTRNEDGVLVNLSQLKRVAKKDEKQGEQKPTEWSEKDEDTLHCIIDALDSLDIRTNTNGEHEDHTEEIYWLKSLRPQPQWKPSEEEMKALKEAVDEHFDIDGGALWHLYEDLKKLKE